MEEIKKPSNRKFAWKIYPKVGVTIDDFGHNLFFDWNNEEWNRFFNYMLNNLQKYLREGLSFRQSDEMKYKKLAQITSNPFACFCRDHDLNGHEHNSKGLYAGFISIFPEESNVTPHMFPKFLVEYPNIFNLQIKRRKSDGNSFVYFRQ